MAATLREAGLQKWIQPFRARAGIADSNTFTLTVAGGIWSQDWSKDGGPVENNDYGPYRIVGDTVIVTHGAGTDTFHWSVSADTLTLEFVKAAGIPPTRGIPEEVFQRAFFTATPLHRRT
jgi:hypothetical protein